MDGNWCMVQAVPVCCVRWRSTQPPRHSHPLRAEGLNRQQRRQLAALEAARKARDADAARAASQMAAAIKGGGGGGGASWGMDDEDWASGNGADDAGGEVDWRKWIAKNTPTEKQEKLLDRIRYVLLG